MPVVQRKTSTKKVKSRVTKTKSRVKKVKSRVKKTKSRVKKTKSRVKKTKSRVKKVKSRVKKVKSRVKSGNKRIVYKKLSEPKKACVRNKVAIVMREFKNKRLKSSAGYKVKNPKQGIAIALAVARKACL